MLVLVLFYFVDQLHEKRGFKIAKLETFAGIVVSGKITSTAIEHGLHHMDQRQGAAMMQIERSFGRQNSGFGAQCDC